MKHFLYSILLLGLTALGSRAATLLELKDVAAGKYTPQRITGIVPLADGETYAQLSTDRQQIQTYSFKTGMQTGTLFDTQTARGAAVKRIDSYVLSPDEQTLLIQTNTRQIYRHSFTADYYLYARKNNTLTALSDSGAVQAPLFSPDGTMVAFVRNNDLYLVKLLFGNSESRVTKDGAQGRVINGIPDWVNEEEFATARSFDFTADSQMLVWVRYDESDVPLYTFPLYKGLAPEQKAYRDYPGAYSYKYPVAGQQNARVSVKSFDIKSHVARTLAVPLDADGYIPRLQATADPNKVAVATLNRHQNRFDLYMANPRSTLAKLALREENDKYVTEEIYTALRFLGDRFVLTSDRSGYKHLYLYNLNGTLVRPLTGGHYDVSAFYGADPKGETFYYASHEEGAVNQTVYAVDIKGKKQKLSEQTGNNSAVFSGSCGYFLNTYSNLNTPPVTALYTSAGKRLKTLVDNRELANTAAGMATKELFTFRTSEGVELNGWIVKPTHFSPDRQYPLILFQYSGPGSQKVENSWNTGFYAGGVFEAYLAQQGFLVACVDGRGTGGRGAEWEKCTYLRLGDLESKDQVEAALYLGRQSYVDAGRIGIWGWSFGGFNTLMSMSEGRNVFRAGVAVAAPTDWRFYDTVYTERYMRTPAENPAGYDINPIRRASALHGSLLLIHGTADDNVHERNLAEYSEALVQAGVPFDMHVYTNRNHNISGGKTREHVLTKIVDFLSRQLR